MNSIEVIEGIEDSKVESYSFKKMSSTTFFSFVSKRSQHENKVRSPKRLKDLHESETTSILLCLKKFRIKVAMYTFGKEVNTEIEIRSKSYDLHTDFEYS